MFHVERSGPISLGRISDFKMFHVEHRSNVSPNTLWKARPAIAKAAVDSAE